MPVGQALEEGSATQAQCSDEEVIARILKGDSALFELLIRRYNQRVYRAVRAILGEDAECEDVMQEAYIRAYQHLASFEHRAAFSTWLTRIAVHEALARLRSNQRFNHEVDVEELEPQDLATGMQTTMSPEQLTASAETRRLLEEAIVALPLSYRSILMLRDVEEMNTAETAVALDITESAVKVRLHRARALLRRELFRRAGATTADAFQFPATRCDRVTSKTLSALGLPLRVPLSRNTQAPGA
jgi:RNA polymerase sigma-70 factor (ECF subfamily)